MLLWKKKLIFFGKNLHLIVDTTQYCDTQQTIQNTKYIVGYIISFQIFVGLVKAVFEEMVCWSWIGLGTSGSWTVYWQRQMMFVDSDRWSVSWQMTVLFWNDDSHCEIRGQRPMDICYYRVGGRIPRTRCLAPSGAFCSWTCFFDSGFNRYLRQTVEGICAFCLVHGQRVKPFNKQG